MAVQIYNNYEDTTNPSDVTPRTALRAGEAVSFTVPGDASVKLQALFSFNDDSNVYVGYNQAPTIPAPGVMATGQFVEFKPEKRILKGGDVIHFATPDPIAYFGISFRNLVL